MIFCFVFIIYLLIYFALPILLPSLFSSIGAVEWLEIHQRIRNMIQSVFESATRVHPEMHSPTSRAMYGVDVMLDCSFQPKLLEVYLCFSISLCFFVKIIITINNLHSHPYALAGTMVGRYYFSLICFRVIFRNSKISLLPRKLS